MFGNHSFLRSWSCQFLTTLLLITGMTVSAAPPLWWSEGNPPVVNASAASNNHGPANTGQAKWMANRALAALRQILPQTADAIEADLVGDGKPIATWDAPSTPEQQAKQREPLLLGQLKAISAPFYLHLHGVAPQWLAEECGRNNISQSTEGLPWTLEVTDDANRSVTLIGQLKALFSLDFAADYETEEHQDGISDLWEHVVVNANPNDPWTNIGDINSGNTAEAGTGTGVGNPPDTSQPPVDPDTDKDGLKDSEDADKDDAAVCWKKAPESRYAVLELPTLPIAAADVNHWDLGEGGHVMISNVSGWEYPDTPGPPILPSAGNFKTHVWQPSTNTWSASLPLPDDIRATGNVIDGMGNVHGEGYTGMGYNPWYEHRAITCQWNAQSGSWLEAKSDLGTGAFTELRPLRYPEGPVASFLAQFGPAHRIISHGADPAFTGHKVERVVADVKTDIFHDSSSFYSQAPGFVAGEPKGWHVYSYMESIAPTDEGQTWTYVTRHKFASFLNGQVHTRNAPASPNSAADLACIDGDLTVDGKKTAVVWVDGPMRLDFSATFIQDPTTRIGYSADDTVPLEWKTSTRPQAERISGKVNARGEGLGGSRLWRNGKWQPLSEFVDAAKWINVSGIDINDKGLILAKADKVNGGEEGKNMPVLLAPLDLAFIKPGTETDTPPQEIADNKEDSEGEVVGINWDDDNNSEGDGGHAKLIFKNDFDDANGTAGENDLIQLKLRGLVAEGAKARLKYDNTFVKIWQKADRKDEVKSEVTEMDLVDDKIVYIEGKKLTEAEKPKELEMQIKVESNGAYAPGDSVKIHVATPIVSFGGKHEWTGGAASRNLVDQLRNKEYLGARRRDDRNNTVVLKGKNQKGKMLWYSVDVIDLVPYTAGSSIIDKPLVTARAPSLDKDMKMALSLEGAHIFYDGHSNFGLGPNFKSDPTSLDDYMNISGRDVTTIDYEELIGNHGDPNVTLRASDYVTEATNSMVAYVGQLKFSGPPNGSVLTKKDGMPIPGHPYHFTRPSSHDPSVTNYEVIVNSGGDLPILRYKSCFMASCNTGRHFYESLNQGTLIFSMAETLGTIGPEGSIENDLLTFPGRYNPSLPSGELGDSWGATHYVRLLTEGKSWDKIVAYFNEQQTLYKGKKTEGLYRHN
jgi:hypothetical protein